VKKYYFTAPIAIFLIINGFACKRSIDKDRDIFSKNDKYYKIESFLNRENLCKFAVFEIAKSKERRETLPLLNGVRCVDDLVFNKGTINEQHGCAAFILRIDTGERKSLYPGLGINKALGKKCLDGGFEEVMNDLLINRMGEKILVKSQFKQLAIKNPGFRIVVRSNLKKYEDFVGLPLKVDLSTINNK